jgi:hypothetical protein
MDDWKFDIVRAQSWAVTAGKLGDDSAYWLHVGPVCLMFAFHGKLPVAPLTRGLALLALRDWGHRVLASRRAVTRLARRQTP